MTTETTNAIQSPGQPSPTPTAKLRASMRAKWRSWLQPRLVISGCIVLVMVIMAIFPQLFVGFGHGPNEHCDLLMSNKGPSAGHWFGRDTQGCDYYTQVIYGARAAITVGVVVSAIAFVISAALGALAGYFGGWVDAIISRVCDMAFGLPFILAAIVVLQLFSERNLGTVIFALSLFSWPGGVRYMRSAVLEVRGREFIQATRLLGGSRSRIIVRHVVPNSITPLLVLQTLGVGSMISAEAGLTFIGIGLTPPAVSWGLQLAAAKDYIDEAAHLLVFPSIFLAITVLGFVLFGEALRDRFDPKGR